MFCVPNNLIIIMFNIQILIKLAPPQPIYHIKVINFRFAGTYHIATKLDVIIIATYVATCHTSHTKLYTYV